MASSFRRRTPRTVTPAAFAKLKRALENCTDEIEQLKRELEINIRRMAAMQAEIDHLTARKS
jgi:hypothetical protein